MASEYLHLFIDDDRVPLPDAPVATEEEPPEEIPTPEELLEDPQIRDILTAVANISSAAR